MKLTSISIRCPSLSISSPTPMLSDKVNTDSIYRPLSALRDSLVLLISFRVPSWVASMYYKTDVKCKFQLIKNYGFNNY